EALLSAGDANAPTVGSGAAGVSAVGAVTGAGVAPPGAAAGFFAGPLSVFARGGTTPSASWRPRVEGRVCLARSSDPAENSPPAVLGVAVAACGGCKE